MEKEFEIAAGEAFGLLTGRQRKEDFATGAKWQRDRYHINWIDPQEQLPNPYDGKAHSDDVLVWANPYETPEIGRYNHIIESWDLDSYPQDANDFIPKATEIWAWTYINKPTFPIPG